VAKELDEKQKAAKAELKNVKILVLVDVVNLGLVCGQITEVEASVAKSLIEQDKADDGPGAIDEHESIKEEN